MTEKIDFMNSGHDSARIVLPSILAVLLFAFAFFGFMLPFFENSLLEKKKEAARELTHVALHLLAHHDDMVQQGMLSLEEGQRNALETLRSMRYGPDNKDYFWINDTKPVMIMHPYRPDLEGRNLADFQDPTGNPLFMRFVELTRQEGSGYVPYIWQWQDTPEMEAKLSYVRLFVPWGWIIGTGIYLEDVDQEIAAVTRRVIYLMAFTLGMVFLLSAYVVRHGMRIAAQRRSAVADLRRYQEQLEELVTERTGDLEKALAEVKRLSGLLPICAACKKIKNGDSWQQIEVYIRDHSDADFSHGICPECVRILYPGLIKDDEVVPGADGR
jgi:signal transduction histidine kinase